MVGVSDSVDDERTRDEAADNSGQYGDSGRRNDVDEENHVDDENNAEKSAEELPLRRPLYFITTVFYFGAIVVIVTGLLVTGAPLLLAQYGGIGMLLSVPIAWWLTGRNSGFQGLPPSNLGFLFGVLVVAGIGFPAFRMIDMETSFVAFLILVIIALAVGRYLEGATERWFGHLWGADRNDDTDATSEDEKHAEQSDDETADEAGTDNSDTAADDSDNSDNSDDSDDTVRSGAAADQPDDEDGSTGAPEANSRDDN